MKIRIIRPGHPPKEVDIPGPDRDLGPFLGRWRIVEMELWAREFLDVVAPAEIVLDAEGHGTMTFVAVHCDLDVEREDLGDPPRIAWCWRGWDDTDEAAGRGWATIGDDGELHGRIYFHAGDASDFRAERIPS